MAPTHLMSLPQSAGYSVWAVVGTAASRLPPCFRLGALEAEPKMEIACNSQGGQNGGWGKDRQKVRLQLESGFSRIHRGSGAQSGFHPEARAWPFIPQMPVSHWLKPVRVRGAEGHQWASAANTLSSGEMGPQPGEGAWEGH